MLTKSKINEAFKGFFDELKILPNDANRPVRTIAGFKVSAFRMWNAKGCLVPWSVRYEVHGVTPQYYADRDAVVKYLFKHQKEG